MKTLTIVFAFLFSYQAQAMHLPDPLLTPSVLCTQSDPDFMGLDYPEQIARCNRNIQDQEKLDVAEKYGSIPRDQWSNYEFDHLIPLCAGGSNSPENLWPQPIEEAKGKDVIEVRVCNLMKAGKMSQAGAIAELKLWFQSLEK